MPNPWDAEITVTSSLAETLIARQFPELLPLTVQPFGFGFDNTAFLVNDSLIFRFPRRMVAVPFLATECRILPALASALPYPIPVPIYIGQADDDYRWAFAGYRKLAGRTACSLDLSVGERARLAAPLANFLKNLHAFPADRAAALGIKTDTIRRLDWQYRSGRAETDLAWALEEGHLRSDPAPLRAVIQSGDVPPRSDTLVHGDLYARHILVNDERDLCGVIDWGDVHLGDPAIDLAIAHILFPPQAHPDFRDAYGPVAGDTWRLARFRALSHSLMALRYAVAMDDQNLLRECKIALTYLGSEQPWRT